MSKKSKVVGTGAETPKGEIRQVKADLLKEAVLLTVTFRKFGNRRKANVKQLTENENGESTGSLACNETKRLKVSKQLIESKELQAIINYQMELYSWVKSKTVPSFIKEGFYLLNLSEVKTVQDKFAEAQDKLKDLVNKFAEAYPNQIEEAKAAFAGGTLFRASDYPSVEVVKSLFSIDYNLFNFEVSQALPPEVREAEIAKVEKAFEDAKGLVTQVLVTGFEELLSGIQDKLAPGTDGKAKAFHKTLFDDLAEFMANFNSRNLVNDKDLGALVSKANSILTSVRGDKVQDKALVVKSSDELREATRAQFQAIQAAIESDIKPKLGRAFNFDLD